MNILHTLIPLFITLFLMAFALLFAVAGGTSAAYIAMKKYYATRTESIDDPNVIDNDNGLVEHKYDPVLEDLILKFKSIEVTALEDFCNRKIKLEPQHS